MFQEVGLLTLVILFICYASFYALKHNTKIGPPPKKKEHRQSSIKASPTGVLNGKLNIKKILFWLFYVYFAHSKGRAKQNAKMSFLSHKCYSYISFKKAKTNKVGPLKK
jgi:hypothetical protein